MLKLYGKKNKKLTVDLSTVNELKENDKILIASNGKMKQIDQDLVNIGGGGGSTPSMPIVGDGKTRLYVTVASMDRPVISINFGCTVVGGVTIDWGDGSDTEVTTNTQRTRYSHSYSAAGDYIIVLEVTDGELVLEGVEDDGGCRGIMQVFAYAEEIPYTLSYNCSTLKMVEIGNSVTSIGDYAFYDCRALTSIVILEGVTSIGRNAFCYCTALTSVVIPSSVTSIGYGAFYYCYSLTSIVIPEGVTSIGEDAFYDCTALTSVTIPSSATSIGNGAFSGCRALTYIVIPEGVTSIGEWSFSSCYALPSVVIPSSVTSIGDHAFDHNYALTSIVIPEGVTSIGAGAFYECSALTSIVIPSSVTSIGDSAFSNCQTLISVTIPSSVTSIKNETFIGCRSLGGIRFLSSTPPALEAGSFDSVPEDCKIYIPTGSLEAYSAAEIWSDYASMLVEE